MPATPTTINRLFLARALRDFGDGFVAVLLPVYLASLGMSPFEIGVVATAALLGSAITTLAIGFVGNRVAERLLLLVAAGLMVVTGLGLATATAPALVLAVACLGTINPSSGTVSIFIPLEHTVLTRAAGDTDRTRLFARYSLIGALAAAAGALAAASPELIERIGIGAESALRSMFLLYATLGLAIAALYRTLPAPETSSGDKAAPRAILGPSRGIVLRLAALFALDAFAGGFVVQSLLALWLFQKFDVSLATAAVFFFWTGVLSAFSFPVAAWLSRRIGLVNTMVFTHVPANVCLILAALSPSIEIALGLLIFRSALSQMDVPTRSSYVMAVVTPAERPAAASFTAVPRSLASAASPALAGLMFSTGHDAWPLIVAGGLKLVYDAALLWMFRHIRPPEERA
jgi:MFS family permease